MKLSRELLRRIKENHVMEIVVTLEDEISRKSNYDTIAGDENSYPRNFRSMVKLRAEAQARMLPILERLTAKPESYKRANRTIPEINLENRWMRNEFFNVVLMHADEDGLRALNKLQGVRSLCENLAMRNTSCMAPPQATGLDQNNVNWGIPDLKIEKIWNAGFRGQGMRIGHLDSGVHENHPDLKGKVKSFVSFSAYYEPIPSSPFETFRAHGTQTAGVLVGGDFSERIIGVAPEAKLVSAVALPNNVTSHYLCAQALAWIMTQDVDVVNISFGIYPGYDIRLDPYLNDLRNLGILTVCAVGNYGIAGSVTPGHNKPSCSVGAYDKNHDLWNQSAGATLVLKDRAIVRKPNLLAPGVSVCTTSLAPAAYPVPILEEVTGTSVAAPFVAAGAVLLKQFLKESAKRMTPKRMLGHLERAIYGTCASSHQKGRKDPRYGVGFFKPFTAFQELQ